METARRIERSEGQNVVDVANEVRLACNDFGQDKITVAIPAKLCDDISAALLAMPEVTSVILADRRDALAKQFPGRVGWFYENKRRWHFPVQVTRSVLFLGVRRQLSFGMLQQALRRNIRYVIIKTPFGWSSVDVFGLATQRMLRALVVELILRPARRTAALGHGPLARVFALTGISAAMKWGMRGVYNVFQVILLRKVQSTILAIASGRQTPLLSAADFIPGRVVLINSALAWGGAERQLVNTAVGLTSRGIRDVTVLCDSSDNVPDHDFFLWRLEAAGVEVTNLRRGGERAGNANQLKEIEKQLGALTSFGLSIGEEIGFFARSFLESRPEIVHAWQDQTSIKAGIAAALVGIPKIVLSGRNMAPYRFQYNLPYMRGAYRALECDERIELLNNSNAGAADYASWLDLPLNRLRVIHNGFDFESLTRSNEESLKAFRNRIGIPDGVRIVGSIFRLYEEKDPMLWIRTAALIGAARSDVVFLVVGTGVMQEAVSEYAARLGIGDRLFMPGTEKKPALAYGIMDVFLLTSRFEGLPNVILEAQSLGVPVVATDVGGTREAVLENQTGFVFEDRHPDRLAEQVLFVLDNAEWADNARRLAPSFVRERFGMGRMIDETLNVYGWGKVAKLSKQLSS